MSQHSLPVKQHDSLPVKEEEKVNGHDYEVIFFKFLNFLKTQKSQDLREKDDSQCQLPPSVSQSLS